MSDTTTCLGLLDVLSLIDVAKWGRARQALLCQVFVGQQESDDGWCHLSYRELARRASVSEGWVFELIGPHGTLWATERVLRRVGGKRGRATALKVNADLAGWRHVPWVVKDRERLRLRLDIASLRGQDDDICRGDSPRQVPPNRQNLPRAYPAANENDLPRPLPAAPDPELAAGLSRGKSPTETPELAAGYPRGKSNGHATPLHNAFGSTTYFSSSSEQEEEELAAAPKSETQAARQVLAAIREVSGKALYREPRQRVIDACADLADPVPLVAELLRSPKRSWGECLQLVEDLARGVVLVAARRPERDRSCPTCAGSSKILDEAGFASPCPTCG